MSNNNKGTIELRWGVGAGAITLIVLASLFGFALIPFLKRRWFPYLLTSLVGLAVGVLAGTSILTLIPEAFGLEHKTHPDHIGKATVILGGVYFFFLTERVVKILTIGKSLGHGHDHHENDTHEHVDAENKRGSISTISTNTNISTNMVTEKEALYHHKDVSDFYYSPKIVEKLDIVAMGNGVLPVNDGYGQTEMAVKDIEASQDLKKKEKAKTPMIAWMLTSAETFHHAIDGMAVGVAFAHSVSSGLGIAVAIFIEEFTHKLGDYAILLNAGMHPCKAMLFNFLQSCGNYVGFIIGMIIGQSSGVGAWIFAFASGMFVYIALVDMIPEMDHNLMKQENKKWGVVCFVCQNVGLFIGFAITLIFAVYGDQISFENKNATSHAASHAFQDNFGIVIDTIGIHNLTAN